MFYRTDIFAIKIGWRNDDCDTPGSVRTGQNGSFFAASAVLKNVEKLPNEPHSAP